MPAWNGKAARHGQRQFLLHALSATDGLSLRHGYAVAGSDTGHQGDTFSFGAGHPEKIHDWAYRSTHGMAETDSKAREVRVARLVSRSTGEGASPEDA